MSTNTSNTFICHTRLYAARRARTPQGDPILVITPPADGTLITPVQAMIQHASSRHGIHSKAEHWTLVAHEQVTIPSVIYQHVFYFTFGPEESLRVHHGRDEAALWAHIRDAYYLTDNWRQGTPKQSLATTLLTIN